MWLTEDGVSSPTSQVQPPPPGVAPIPGGLFIMKWRHVGTRWYCHPYMITSRPYGGFNVWIKCRGGYRVISQDNPGLIEARGKARRHLEMEHPCSLQVAAAII